MALERAAHGGDRRERGGNDEHHGKRAEGEGPVDEPSPATPPEEQDGGRDREEQPGLEVQLEEGVHPVVDEEALREEHEEKRGRHERECEPPLRGVPKSRGRDEEEEDADPEQDVDPAHPEQDQAEKREREEDPPNRPAPSPPRHRLVSRRESPCERQEEEEPEDGQDVDPGRALGAPAHVGPAARADPEGRREEQRRARCDPEAEKRAGGGAGGPPRRAERGRTGEERQEPGKKRDVPGVGQSDYGRGGSEQRRRDAPLRKSARGIRVRPHEREAAGEQEEEQRNGEDVRVQVGEDEAPEGILVDRVPDDPARRPEVVPVERPLVEEPFAEPGQIAEDRRSGPPRRSRRLSFRPSCARG